MSALIKAIANSEQADSFSAIASGVECAGAYLARHARKTGIKEINMLVLGGAALHLTGYRDRFNDIDIMVKQVDLKKTMTGTLLKSGTPPMDIEIGFDLKLGSLNDPLAFERSSRQYKEVIQGVTVITTVYPEAYFLILKMEHGREKCLSDINTMLMGIDHMKVIDAFNNLAKVNERWVMDDIANMLVTDYAMLSTTSNNPETSLSIIKDLYTHLDIDESLNKSFKMMYFSLKSERSKRDRVNENPLTAGMSI